MLERLARDGADSSRIEHIEFRNVTFAYKEGPTVLENFSLSVRAGQTIALEPRNIIIHDIALRGFSSDRLQVSVHCSKGTYIRVLAEDIGRNLGCGATLAALRRVAVGEFDVALAVSLDRLEAMSEAQRIAILLPVDSLVYALPRIMLEADLVRRMVMGQAGQFGGSVRSGAVRLYDHNQRFLGLGEVQPGGRLVPKRLVATAVARPIGPASLTTTGP